MDILDKHISCGNGILKLDLSLDDIFIKKIYPIEEEIEIEIQKNSDSTEIKYSPQYGNYILSIKGYQDYSFAHKPHVVPVDNLVYQIDQKQIHLMITLPTECFLLDAKLSEEELTIKTIAHSNYFLLKETAIPNTHKETLTLKFSYQNINYDWFEDIEYIVKPPFIIKDDLTIEGITPSITTDSNWLIKENKILLEKDNIDIKFSYGKYELEYKNFSLKRSIIFDKPSEKINFNKKILATGIILGEEPKFELILDNIPREFSLIIEENKFILETDLEIGKHSILIIAGNSILKYEAEVEDGIKLFPINQKSYQCNQIDNIVAMYEPKDLVSTAELLIDDNILLNGICKNGYVYWPQPLPVGEYKINVKLEKHSVLSTLTISPSIEIENLILSDKTYYSCPGKLTLAKYISYKQCSDIKIYVNDTLVSKDELISIDNNLKEGKNIFEIEIQNGVGIYHKTIEVDIVYLKYTSSNVKNFISEEKYLIGEVKSALKIDFDKSISNNGDIIPNKYIITEKEESDYSENLYKIYLKYGYFKNPGEYILNSEILYMNNKYEKTMNLSLVESDFTLLNKSCPQSKTRICIANIHNINSSYLVFINKNNVESFVEDNKLMINNLSPGKYDLLVESENLKSSNILEISSIGIIGISGIYPNTQSDIPVAQVVLTNEHFAVYLGRDILRSYYIRGKIFLMDNISGKNELRVVVENEEIRVDVSVLPILKITPNNDRKIVATYTGEYSKLTKVEVFRDKIQLKSNFKEGLIFLENSLSDGSHNLKIYLLDDKNKEYEISNNLNFRMSIREKIELKKLKYKN